MKKLMISLLIVQTIFLTGCKTIEFAHVDVGCLGQSQELIRFTDQEKAALTDEMKLKIRRLAVTLRQRMKSQCEINETHDKEFKVK